MKNRNLGQSIRLKLATNIVLGVLILSIGALCLSPIQESVSTKSDDANIYRCVEENPKGVSLMFNVYWGTDEVYHILTILSEYDALATFFIGGCWADDNVDCLKAIYDAGHEIGNHGYFHKDHSKFNVEENQKEINACNQFIQRAIGIKPVLFAPPSGSFSKTTLKVAESLGYQTIMWSKDTIDWRDNDVNLIVKRATDNITAGDLILMHPKDHTVEALKEIITIVNSKGLKCVTVTECVGL